MQSFSELPLSAPIAKAITELGFEKPSPIQAETLPILLGDATDFLGLAATGTGKTAAFAIPMLERINPSIRAVQALILCPTRELALQVAQQVSLLGKHKGIRPVAVYGGAPYGEQIAGLRSGAQVVVGTPGRVCDHIDKGTLRLDQLQTLILDEADEMISMGFKDELEKVLSAAPRESTVDQAASNIWLFSATMSREVRRVADQYLRSPKQVQINRTEMLPTTIEQYYYPTAESNKPEILCKLIESAEDFYGLIFCQTKALVVDLTQYLHERGYKVDSLHGDKDQTARERTMQSFRDRKVTVLVCTDVASRGLDVKDITHVINYSLPRELDSYVHRIGRTGRSGKTGIAMNLVTQSHRRLIFAIENMTKTRMLEGVIPTRREIGARKVNKRLENFNDQPFFSRALEVMNEDWKTTVAAMTPEEVAARFLTMIMPDVFNEKVQSAAEKARAATAATNKTVIAPRAPSAYGGGGGYSSPASSRPSFGGGGGSAFVPSSGGPAPISAPIAKAAPTATFDSDMMVDDTAISEAPVRVSAPAAVRPAVASQVSAPVLGGVQTAVKPVTSPFEPRRTFNGGADRAPRGFANRSSDRGAGRSFGGARPERSNDRPAFGAASSGSYTKARPGAAPMRSSTGASSSSYAPKADRPPRAAAKPFASERSSSSSAMAADGGDQVLNRKMRRALQFGIPYNEPGENRQGE